jgi:hypothetical protein
LKYAKFRGGFAADWIGYWFDYQNFRAGLNELRAKWAADWTRQRSDGSPIVLRDFREGLR